jgi:prepilin-type N-terminal cleavage/methylation domain-containing protein
MKPIPSRTHAPALRRTLPAPAFPSEETGASLARPLRKRHRAAFYQRARRAFSLLELMVVVMIIGILTGLVVPAVDGIGKSSALTTGGALVAHLVDYARQEAMTKNTLTALVVLGNQGTDADFRALAVLEYDPVTGWSQTGNWEMLPTGITVDCTDTINCSFLLNSPQPFPFLTRFAGQMNPPVRFRGVQVADHAGYAARIFLPNGALQNPEQPAQLRLVEGYVQGGQTTYTNRSGGQAPDNYYDVAILGMTGTTKIDRP